MSTETYQALIQDVCSICEISPPASAEEGCDIVMMDVPFTLAYQVTVDCVAIFCDLGKIPEVDGYLVLKRLLEINTFALEPGAPLFAVNPETSHVLLKGFLPVDVLTADELLESMGSYVWIAQRWCATRFLEDEPQPELLSA